MEADLYNLLPAAGALNHARQNFAYGMIEGEARRFGGCDFEVQNGRVEPPAAIRGDIARIYFYMDTRYPGFFIVNSSNKELLEQWDHDDPLSPDERSRLDLIQSLQGNSFYIGRLATHLASRRR